MRNLAYQTADRLRGIGAAFGSILDYNVGVAWAPMSRSTASARSEIYLRNLFDLIANRGLLLSYRGPPHGWLGLEVSRLCPLSIIKPKVGLHKKHLKVCSRCLLWTFRCDLQVWSEAGRLVPPDT